MKWRSSKLTVAKISSAGKITAKRKGTVKITATYKGKTLTCKVTVKKPALKLNRKKLTLSLKKKRSFTIKATANGRKVSGKKVKWTSSNRKVAIVSRNGKVTAKRRGKTWIKGRINGKEAAVMITVRN